MKTLLSAILLLTVVSARALVFDINLNATNDPAGILSGIYETTPNASTATGGEVGDGITYDTATRGLTINVAYGLFGFEPLTRDFLSAHIHGPAGQGTNAPVLIGLFSGATDIHTELGTRSGFFSGTVTLTQPQEDMLFANLLYMNIHSTPDFNAGEIRGQLIPSTVPEPSSVVLAAAGLALLIVVRRKRA
jgi:hypothetical protein